LGVKVVFLGTGTADSFERAQSSILFEKNGNTILVDAGNGCLIRLGQLGKRPADINAVLLTHVHLDHSGDLLPLLKARWLSGVEDTLKIFAPTGTKNWMESQLEAFPFLRNKLSYDVVEVRENKFNVYNFNVKSIVTKHSVESRGYIVNGILVTGDTSPFEELYNNDFDVVIHELSLPEGFSQHHTTPDSILRFSRILSEKEVYFTHLYPHTLTLKERIIKRLGFGKVVNDLDSFKF